MKGWKTIAFNGANALVGAMAAVTDAVSIPEPYMPYWIALLLGGNFVLRLVTTGPVGRGE